jgi:hypothetical protein
MKSMVVSNVIRTRNVLAFGVVMVAALVAAMLVLVAATKPALAVFPGSNGQIVFHSNRTTGAGVNNPTGDTETFDELERYGSDPAAGSRQNEPTRIKGIVPLGMPVENISTADTGRMW